MKRIIIAVFGLALMQAGAAASPVHYTYTGNPFTPGYGPFAGASITATLYFSSALPDNDTYSNLIPPPTLVSYTVSAGSLTMTNSGFVHCLVAGHKRDGRHRFLGNAIQ